MTRILDDWIESYIQFTEQSEAPARYHLWSSIVAISSVLQRKCYTNWGLIGNIYPNLYVALVGPPGGRKGTAMKIAKGFVQQMDLPMGSDALGSTQILYQEIAKSEQMYLTAEGKERPHKSLSVWSEEFQVFLSDKDPRLISSLTDLFDTPDKWQYNTLSRKVEDLSNCWLTIIGGITPSLLQQKLNLDAVGGGLLSRIILVVEYGPKYKKALQFLSKEEKKLQQALLKDLERIKLLAGPFNMSQEFFDAYSQWYEKESDHDGLDVHHFVGYNSRRALHVKKLCMVMAASENDEMVLEAHHFERALVVLKHTEYHMPNAFFGVGFGEGADGYAKMISKVEQDQRITYRKLMRHMQMDLRSNRDLDDWISRGEHTGYIKLEQGVTGDSHISFVGDPEKSGTDGASELSKTVFRKLQNNKYK